MVERKYDLYSQDFKQNSYTTFAKMRQYDPILQQISLDGSTPIWFFTKYEDVDALLRDKRFTRDWRRVLPPEAQTPESDIERRLFNNMLNKDGDDHRRLRSLVSQAFTPKRIEQLRPRVEALANDLLDAVQNDGEMDLIGQFSAQLPTIVILEMLGIPIEDRDRLRDWSRIFIDLSSEEDFMQKATLLTGYLRDLFAKRRQDPQDDLISAFLAAEEAGDKLSEDEVFSNIVLLIIAGHETTMNLIGNAVLALTQNPDRLEYLKAHPEEMKTAVEEFLRYDAPVERALNRWVMQDLEYKGHQLKKGEPVILVLGSANHDEALFSDADKLMLNREKNPHVSFGKGVHYCLGAPLARLEAEIALNTLLRRLPKLRLATAKEALRWRNSPGFKGLENLPVQWGRP